MPNFTKQQLLDGLRKLPPDVQEIILSEERSDAFHTIMKKHELTVAQIAAVADALAPITFGLMLPKELPDELRRALPMLDSAKIDALVADINTTLLAPIRTRVMETTHDTKTSVTTATQTPNPPQTIPSSPPTHVPRTLGADMTHAKMEGTFRIPPDSITVQAPATPLIPKPTPVAPVRNGQYASADPYREPIN